MGKKPKVRRDPEPRKQPSTGGVEPEPPGLLTWRLADADLDGRWGWRNLDGAHLDELHRDLAGAELATRHELERQKRIKAIPVEHVCREAQERLVKVVGEEHDTLWELRIATRQKHRVWGIVRGSVFRLLWWDPDHTVAAEGPPRGTRRQ